MRERWPMVKYVADRMKQRLPYNVDHEELQASAAAGLLDAIRRFDPGRGVKFETYAPHRMRGFILDDLRDHDWVPRLTRARHNRLERTYAHLEARLGRVPTDRELAGEMGMSVDDFLSLAAECSGASLTPLKKRPLEKETFQFPIDVITSTPDHAAESPLEIATRDDLFARLKEIMPPKLAEVLDLYYHDELTLKEIGRKLNLSESRVCQLHAKALRFARQRLQAGAPA